LTGNVARIVSISPGHVAGTYDRVPDGQNRPMAQHEDIGLGQEFAQALAARTSPAYWRRVAHLQQQGTREILDYAATALGSRNAKRRQLGADVLGQLGYQHPLPPFKGKSASVLKALLKVERDPSVLAAVVMALARLRVRSAINLLEPLAKHRSKEVRLALAAELPWCTWDSGEERPDPRVTATLIDLSRDPAAEVRNWACFSLSSSGEDSTDISAALWERTRDRHYDTRIEALRGLALRRDARVRSPLREAVQAIGADRLGTWVIDDLLDYAEWVRDRQLIKALRS
jgi:HEAT repeat protein